jgi:hypothetical protein
MIYLPPHLQYVKNEEGKGKLQTYHTVCITAENEKGGTGKTYALRKIAVLMKDEGYTVASDYENNRLYLTWRAD